MPIEDRCSKFHLVLRSRRLIVSFPQGHRSKVGGLLGYVRPCPRRWAKNAQKSDYLLHRRPLSVPFVPIRGIDDYAKSYLRARAAHDGPVGLLLVIACTNVALLILAGCAARQREFAIRIATGARPVRILRQLVAESLVIGGAGAKLGWVLAIGATGMLARWARIDAGLNPHRNVLLFTPAIASLVAVAFSVTPFMKTMQISVDQALRSTTQTSTQGGSRARVGNLVIAAQIALCFTLLVAAGLTVRTLLNYERVDLGMNADQLLIFDVDPQGLTAAFKAGPITTD